MRMRLSILLGDLFVRSDCYFERCLEDLGDFYLFC